jgi:RNA polymerase sigma factor (sigma-70 family)
VARASAGEVGRHLRQLFAAGSGAGLDDGRLLEQFAAAARRGERDSAEAAFETVLARHGATVLSVCRQVLGDGHAAEDAFQATFLVLVRRAGSLRVRDGGTLGGWLHAVAYRTALKARRGAARRRARERRAAGPEGRAGSAVAAVEAADLGAALHAEVARLPARYRSAVVLCYFEGRTHDEAAAALGWPVGTVRRRLSCARDLLRKRLTRRGLAPAVAALGAAGTGSVSRAEVPAPLCRATLEAAVRAAPASVAALLTDILSNGLIAARWRMVAAAFVLVALVTGIAFVPQGSPGSPRQPSRNSVPTRVATLAQTPPEARPDDPLPAHARARLGTIRFHGGDSVGQIFFTPDGKSLVTSDATNIIRVWDAASGRVVREIGDPKIDFREMALSPDGKTLATTIYPSQLRLWDVATGREKKRWHEAQDEDSRFLELDHSLGFAPDGRTLAVGVRQYHQATKTEEKWIDLRDAAGPSEHRRRLKADWLRLNDLAFAPDGRTLATASIDTEVNASGQQVGPEKGSVRLWDLATGRERRRFAVEGRSVQSLAISPDSRWLAASITDGTLPIYDLATGREREPRLSQQPADRLQAMTCLRFSPDGSILAGGAQGVVAYRGDFSLADVHLWDVATGRERHRIPAHQQGISSLAFAPDGRTLASCGIGAAIRFWDVATGREVIEHLGHRSAIRNVAVSPVDGTVFTGGYDGTIRRWEPASGREIGIIAQFPDPAIFWSLAPDARFLVAPTDMGMRLELWSVAERREIRRLPRASATTPVQHVIWSPDGKTVAAEGRIWDVATGRVRLVFRTRDGQDASTSGWFPISYSPDGKTVICERREELSFWDVASGKEAGPAVRLDRPCGVAVALSPDGRLLASGGIVSRSSHDAWVDPPIRLYEVATGRVVATMNGHEETTCGLAFSPDGRWLASGSGGQWSANDCTVRIWSVATGRELRRFEGHRGRVNALVFTPDGRSLVSAGEDATALVWDVSDLRER